jgi:hypothetical protein
MHVNDLVVDRLFKTTGKTCGYKITCRGLQNCLQALSVQKPNFYTVFHQVLNKSLHRVFGWFSSVNHSFSTKSTTIIKNNNKFYII